MGYDTDYLIKAQAVLSSDFMSIRKFMAKADMSYATACRYLNYLTATERAEMESQGKGTRARRLYRLKRNEEVL
jgi:response regulator of citrate/malate metabolism